MYYGRLSFLQKCVGIASCISCGCILSEMAAEPDDQREKKESELSYVLKLIIYLDIFYLGKDDDESFAKNIESILNFFQKN